VLPTQTEVEAVLARLVDPSTGRDYVSGKAVKAVAVRDGDVVVDLLLGYPARSVLETVRQQVASALQALPGVRAVAVSVQCRIVPHAVQRALPLLPGVRNLIAVASGKGGVGKSTVAVNLALALADEGARVGLLDADIYGPSQPLMVGREGARPESADGRQLEPVLSHGIQVMSIGFLVDPAQAMAWRGPMATQALEQLLRDTRWDDLDYLIVDMPPGTGDIQLTLAQKVPVTGAVIVTTPQDVALLDARKGMTLFNKVNVPILGVVENMGLHVCPACGHQESVFGAGGGERLAAEHGVELLGSLPLDRRIREQADAGTPSLVADPAGSVAEAFRAIARRTAARVAERAQDHSASFPKIVIRNS
jgi:ATP-binding protein involved in chromosome partitioning